MKLSSIIQLCTLCAIARGWATMLSPIVLSIGAALTALNFDVDPLLEKTLIWFKKEEEKEEEKDWFAEIKREPEKVINKDDPFKP